MANYYAIARSNYFRFDPAKLAVLQTIFGPEDIEVVHNPTHPGLVTIISRAEGGCPTAMIDTDELTDALFELGIPDADNIDEVELVDLLYTLLPATDPTSSLVWIEVGSEKARYLVGMATRYDHTGLPTQHIDLNEIFREGEQRAEY